MKKPSIILSLLFSLFAHQSNAQVLDCVSGVKSVETTMIMSEYTVAYAKPVLCKPLLVSGFSAVNAINSSIYTLNWSKEEHSLWNIASYDVRVNGTAIRTYDYSMVLPISIDEPGDLASFEVRACASVVSDDPLSPLVSCSAWKSAATQCEGGCPVQPNTLSTSNISIYKDPYRNSFRFNWIDNQAAVTDFQIQALDFNDTEIGEIKQFGKSAFLPMNVSYDAENIQPSKFKLRACIFSVAVPSGLCGQWSEVITPSFLPARVIYLESLWSVANPTSTNVANHNGHYLKFKYPNEYTDNNTQLNAYFKLSLQRSNGVVFDPINYSEGISVTIGSETLITWNSDEFLNYQSPNNPNNWLTLYNRNTFYVQTCIYDSLSGEEICSGTNSIPVSDRPVVFTEQFAIPSADFSCDETTGDFTLSAFYFGSSQNGDKIDYFKVLEQQPIFEPLTDTTIGAKSLEYYLQVDNQNQATINLKRMANGEYSFKVAACHRDRKNGDACSAFVSAGISVPGGTAYQCTINRNIASVSSVSNLKWYDLNSGDTSKKVIKWNYTGAVKPDYFYIKKQSVNINNQANQSGAQINACVDERDVYQTQGSTTTTPTTYSKFEFAHYLSNEEHNLTNVTVLFDDPEYWSTRGLCSDGIHLNTNSQDNKWNVYACQNGKGCSAPAIVDLDLSGDESTTIPTINNPLNFQFHAAGGPADMKPGVWWNPYQAGTGWHFYWTNQIIGLSDEATLASPFDLKAYWLTYKEIQGQWSPIWLTSNLIQKTDEFGELEKYYKGDLVYSYIENGVLVSENAGAIELEFDPNTNTRATLILDVNYEGNLFSQNQVNYDSVDLNVPSDYTIVSEGKIIIPIEDFAVKIIDNDPNGTIFGNDNNIDHYTGAWENKQNNITVLTWIEKNLELTDVLFYDDDLAGDDRGEPLWVQSQSCGIPCNQPVSDWFPATDNLTPNHYTVTKGFNPLGYADLDYNVSENVETLAHAQRKLNHETTETGSIFNLMQLKFKIALDGTSNDVDLKNRKTNIDFWQDPITLNKVANIHSIEYFITNANGSQIIQSDTCDPNAAAMGGECLIHFNWFTTDDFPSVEAYYTKDGGSLTPLANLCGATYNDTDKYNEFNYQCLILGAGVYKFELRKTDYLNSTNSIAIAESKTLNILECTTAICEEVLLPPATAPNPTNFINSIIADPASDTVGVTSGAFDIDESGSANYSIPIFAPKGTGGLAPQLALSYNSSAGNGIAGVGWNISGISSITRCLKSPEHDPGLDFYPAIQLTDDDALCIDGQRMFKLGDGTYRTELDSFSKITAFGIAGNGPNKFEVVTKSGEKRIYGSNGSMFKGNMFSNGTGAQIISNDGETVHTWLLNEIQDRSTTTNKIYFIWDTYAGENYLSHVKWTNPDSGQHHYQIDFEYSNTRPDARHHYSIGTEYKSFRNLEHISTSIRPTLTADMQEVRRINLNYEDLQGTAPSGMLRLASIEQCLNQFGTCLQPVEFEWDNNNTQVDFLSTSSSSNIGDFDKMGYGSFKPIDVNGDGQMELIFVAGYDDGFFIIESLQARYYVAYHTNGGVPTGVSGCGLQQAGYYNYICDTGIEPFDAEDDSGNSVSARFNSEKWFTLDYNGDGFQDVLSPLYKLNGNNNNDHWVVLLSNGNKLCSSNIGSCSNYAPVDTNIIYYNRYAGSNLVDYTADGLPDLLTFDEKTVDNEVLYQYKLYPMVKINGVYQFATSPDLAKFIDIDVSKLAPIDMICEFELDGEIETRPCVVSKGENIISGEIVYTSPGYLFVQNINPVSTDFNGDGYNDAILRYAYLYGIDACGLSFFGDTNSETSSQNSVNIPLGEYSTAESASQVARGIEIPICPQLFEAKMLSHITSDGTLEFKFGGRLSAVPNDELLLVGCSTGNGIEDCKHGNSHLRYKSSQSIDLNADGLADYLYMTNDFQYEYTLNQGKIELTTYPDQVYGNYTLAGFSFDNIMFSDVQSIGLFDVTGSCHSQLAPDDYDISVHNRACARVQQTQFIDYDLDGDIDILYPEAEASSNTVNYAIKTFEFFADGTTGYVDRTLQNLKSYDKTEKANKYINTFVDFNGDGHLDHLNIFRDGETNSKSMKLGNRIGKSRNKITKITNILKGDQTEINIDYTVATESSVYAKSTSNLSLIAGNGSPIFDILSPSYLVSSVSKTSPGYGNTQITYYYSGLKVQGGGRGSLGFETITSTDDLHHITTETSYKQLFPYIGMPETTITSYGNNSDFVSQSISSYLHKQTILSNGNIIYFPYLSESIEKDYSFNSSATSASTVGGVQKTIVSSFTYSDIDAKHGNLTHSEIKTCAGDSNCSLVASKITDNIYADYEGNNEANWFLGRLSQTTVTSQRGNQAPKTRTSSFDYDPNTGQLIEEIIHGTADEFLRTEHVYDNYGQQIATYQCSNDFVDRNDCINRAVIARPTDPNYIHRYSKTVYDTVWPEYANKKVEPFTSYANNYDTSNSGNNVHT